MCSCCNCPVTLPHGAVDWFVGVIVIYIDHTHLLIGKIIAMKFVSGG